MSAANLHNIEIQIDQLDIGDKLRLLQYLAPRIAAEVSPSKKISEDIDAAWHRYRALGQRLAATSVAGAAPITEPKKGTLDIIKSASPFDDPKKVAGIVAH